MSTYDEAMPDPNDPDPRDARLFAAIDDVLAGADLQSSSERAERVGEGCCRCRAATDGAGFCGPCRSFLLGDTTVDPVTEQFARNRSETDALLEAEMPQVAAALRRVRQRPIREQLEAGDLYVLTEDRRWLSGQDGVDHHLAEVERLSELR